MVCKTPPWYARLACQDPVALKSVDHFDGLDIESIFLEKDRDEFMKWEEYIGWRNKAHTELHVAYAELMKVLVKNKVSSSLDVEDALERLAADSAGVISRQTRFGTKIVGTISLERIIERCAGLTIVEKICCRWVS